MRWFGARMWMVQHLANDWLAGTWFFLWANLLFTVGSFLFLFTACYTDNAKQIFVWFSR
jgi:hypothetical protein